MKKIKKGFAGMTLERRKEIASMGGKQAHASGNAHEFTSKEARRAGRLGGLARGKKPKNFKKK